jgi:hypothetical protein
MDRKLRCPWNRCYCGGDIVMFLGLLAVITVSAAASTFLFLRLGLSVLGQTASGVARLRWQGRCVCMFTVSLRKSCEL